MTELPQITSRTTVPELPQPIRSTSVPILPQIISTLPSATLNGCANLQRRHPEAACPVDGHVTPPRGGSECETQSLSVGFREQCPFAMGALQGDVIDRLATVEADGAERTLEDLLALPEHHPDKEDPLAPPLSPSFLPPELKHEPIAALPLPYHRLQPGLLGAHNHGWCTKRRQTHAHHLRSERGKVRGRGGKYGGEGGRGGWGISSVTLGSAPLRI